MLVCTLGDLLLDVVVRLGAPLEAGSDAPAQTSLSAGGQAANVAAWAVALGARGRLVCRRGGDGAARLAEEGLAGLGVEIVGPRAGGGGGVVVSLVDPQGDRTMASDRGVSPGLEAADVDPGWLEGADVLHLSGYSLLREPIAAAARHAASLARASGTRVSVDLAAAPFDHDLRGLALRGELGELGPDVVFATVSEEEALGGPLPGAIWVRKRGPAGCEVLHGDQRLALPAEPGPVVDSTGAGDALCRRLPRRRRRRSRTAGAVAAAARSRRDRGRDAS